MRPVSIGRLLQRPHRPRQNPAVTRMGLLVGVGDLLKMGFGEADSLKVGEDRHLRVVTLDQECDKPPVSVLNRIQNGGFAALHIHLDDVDLRGLQAIEIDRLDQLRRRPSFSIAIKLLQQLIQRVVEL